MTTILLAAIAIALLLRLIQVECRRYRRYVYGENAPIPTKDFGQRARTARPDGGTKP